MKPQAQQSVSAREYALMALVMLLIGIALLVYYVSEVPKLSPGVRNQVYYVVLFPSAIACAVALFGAMRSYARLKGKQPGVALELGGPVVVFVLVLWGGFKVVPPPTDTFDLTVRAHSADGSVPVITSGTVTVELGNNRPTRAFGPDGDADFKGVPAKLIGATIKILAHVDGYEEKWQQKKVDGNSVELSLERIRVHLVTFRGFVQDERENPLPGVQVTAPDCDQQALTDAKGVFTFQIEATEQTRCHLIFGKEGYAPYTTDLVVAASSGSSFLLRKTLPTRGTRRSGGGS